MTNVNGIAPVVITPSILAASLGRSLSADQASMATLENQVATGRAVAKPSDNPAQASNILLLQSALTRAKQYASNAQDGVGWLTLGNGTMNSIMNVLQRVQSALVGLTGDVTAGTAGVTTGVATTVSDARQELINLANTQYAGQAIFAGTGTPRIAYNATGTYVGAGVAPTRTVAPGTRVAVAVTGPEVFGPTGATSLLGKTGILATIAAQITSGTVAQINKAATTGLAALQSAMANVEAQAGRLGADQQSMEGFASQATASVAALSTELQGAQDVTLGEATTNLQALQTSYQAALYVLSQVHTDSLLQYL
jgi:flagellar hook-associated protein 3 FlgL